MTEEQQLRKFVADAIDALQYVDRTHRNLTGGGVRAELIAKGRELLKVPPDEIPRQPKKQREVLRYERLHVPSGRKEVCSFKETHDSFFAFQPVPVTPHTVTIGNECCVAWNRQYPDLWRYKTVIEIEGSE